MCDCLARGEACKAQVKTDPRTLETISRCTNLEFCNSISPAQPWLVWDNHVSDGLVGHSNWVIVIIAKDSSHRINLLNNSCQYRGTATRLQLNSVSHHKRPCEELQKANYDTSAIWDTLDGLIMVSAKLEVVCHKAAPLLVVPTLQRAKGAPYPRSQKSLSFTTLMAYQGSLGDQH